MTLDAAQKIRLYTLLARATALDKMMLRVIRSGRMVGFYHEGGIALAPGIAAGAFLERDDPMWPHYRAHAIAHMLAKGIAIESYVAEHMGREAGCCKGRSSIHASFPQDHLFGLSGNIGANFPPCIGYGLAAKYRGTDQVVMNCSGDGSYQEGRAYEAMHMCAAWKLPVIFWCENNGILQLRPHRGRDRARWPSADAVRCSADGSGSSPRRGCLTRLANSERPFRMLSSGRATQHNRLDLQAPRIAAQDIVQSCHVLRAGSLCTGQVQGVAGA